MNKEDLIRHLEEQKFPKDIIDAFSKVERKDFIPEELQEQSYEDIALPIGQEQTISQPYTIAFMLTILQPENKQRILEVGSGSGYVLALLNELNPEGETYGIERINQLAEKSKQVLKDRKNIEVINKDGSKGLQEKAPFDRILVSASCDTIPQKLVNQLEYNGILVAPVKNSIIVVKKKSGGNEIREYPGFSFVPLIED